MADITATDSVSVPSSAMLVARSEDVLLACVAYNRPEMRALDALIRLCSSGDLRVSLLASATTSEGKARSIASLPTDLLLRVRSHLQTSLLQQLAAEATTALAQYGAALVEGLCAGCLWWNADVYCNGVRAWVEAGYRSRIVEAHFKAQTHDDPLR